MNQTVRLISFFIICTAVASAKRRPRMTGGYNHVNAEVCREKLNSVDLEDNVYLRKYIITRCERQVVNGWNYSMDLIPFEGFQTDSGLSVSQRTVHIYEHFSGSPFEARVSQEEDLKEQEVIPGGPMDQKVEVCERKMSQAAAEVSSYLLSYNIVKCSTQVVNGINYDFELVNPFYPALRQSVRIYQQSQNHDQFAVTEENKELPLPSHHLMGGFQPENLTKCGSIALGLSKETLRQVALHKLIKCEKQVVNGLNYRFTFQNAGDSAQLVVVKAYRPIGGEISVSDVSHVDDSVQTDEEISAPFMPQTELTRCFEVIRLAKADFAKLGSHQLEYCQIKFYNKRNTFAMGLINPEDKKTCYLTIDVSLHGANYLITRDDDAQNCFRN